MNNPCIFCGKKAKKSKEHLWSVWMHEFLTYKGYRENTCITETYRWHENIDSKSVTRQGNLRTKKLRVVCRGCNSGWMSVLESKVKPILVKIFRNKEFNIGCSDQVVLSNWITTKVIVGEHADKNTEVTPKSDREKFFVDKKIPEYFAIYIGKHTSEHDTAWQRVSMVLALSPMGPNPPLEGLQRNTQSISFILGPLFVFIFAIRENSIKSTEFFSTNGLKRIYPPEIENIAWPPSKLLSNDELSRYAWALSNIKNAKNVSYADDLV